MSLPCRPDPKRVNEARRVVVRNVLIDEYRMPADLADTWEADADRRGTEPGPTIARAASSGFASRRGRGAAERMAPTVMVGAVRFGAPWLTSPALEGTVEWSCVDE
jgi:hypothetical protein